MTTILNSLTIIVLHQKVFRQRLTIHYMRAIAFIEMFCYAYYNGTETKIAGGSLYYQHGIILI